MKKIKSKTFHQLMLFCCFLFNLAVFGQSEKRMAVAAPNGILIFVGMELANGNKIDQYIIERSYNKQKWEHLIELKSPISWESFQANYLKWKSSFSFQGDPSIEILKTKWQLCEKSNVIDSMSYWSQLTGIRLAAGIAFYDQTVSKDKQVWYRIKSMKNGKSISKVVTSPVQYPFTPQFDPIFIYDKNVSKSLIYLKWESEGNNPAPYFKVQYYEDTILKSGEGSMAQYVIGNLKYYIYQDSIRNLKQNRQYFLNPMDQYGNPSYATEIELVLKTSSEKSFFQYTKAFSDPKALGVILNWKFNNSKQITGFKIYKSDSYDGKTYELLATIPATDTSYKDLNIIPDKMYYYYLETLNFQNDDPQRSNIFFNVGYDQLKPIYPIITEGKNHIKGVSIIIKTTENNLSGVKIYRNNGFTNQLYPITDILKLSNNEYLFLDTSDALSGERSYLYAATCVNTSSVESDFSDTLAIHPIINTIPFSPNRFIAYEEDQCVHLVWEDVKPRNINTKGYLILRRDMPNGKWVTIVPKDTIIEVPFWTDYSAQPSKSYEYAVQTVDEFGGVSESMTLCSITLQEIDLPTPPKVWITQNNGVATIQWSDCTLNEHLKLNIYRYQRGGKPQLIKSCNPKDRKIEDSNAKKGNLYFYYSTFSDEKSNESSPSQETSFKIE